MSKLRVSLIVSWAFAALFGFTAISVSGQKPTPAPPPKVLETKVVVFGAPKRFENPYFTVDRPTNWGVKDLSTTDDANVSFTDPEENAVLVLRVWQDTEPYSDNEKAAMLKKFLTESIGSFPKFAFGETSTQSNGSISLGMRWEEDMDGKFFPMNGISFIRQQNGKVAIVVLIMPTEQYEMHKADSDRMINSFSIR